jgi:hypothetical protein
MRKGLADDKAKVKVYDISPLGIMQISRQRLRKAGPHFSRLACEACQGRGWHPSASAGALSALRKLEERLHGKKAGQTLALSVPHPVANKLMNEFREHLFAMEKRYGCSLRVIALAAASGEASVNVLGGGDGGARVGEPGGGEGRRYEGRNEGRHEGRNGTAQGVVAQDGRARNAGTRKSAAPAVDGRERARGGTRRASTQKQAESVSESPQEARPDAASAVPPTPERAPASRRGGGRPAPESRQPRNQEGRQPRNQEGRQPRSPESGPDRNPEARQVRNRQPTPPDREQAAETAHRPSPAPAANNGEGGSRKRSRRRRGRGGSGGGAGGTRAKAEA